MTGSVPARRSTAENTGASVCVCLCVRGLKESTYTILYLYQSFQAEAIKCSQMKIYTQAAELPVFSGPQVKTRIHP